MNGFRERAFLVCRTTGGRLVAGRVVTGSPTSVPFPTHCPAGANPVAVAHTHPPDNTILASEADLRETAKRGIPQVCVIFQGMAKCYQALP